MPSSVARQQRRLAFFLGISFAMFTGVQAVVAEPIFREDFLSLNNWKPLTFEKIKRHSTYRIGSNEQDGTFLIAESNASSSAIVSKTEFNVYQSPVLRWRWKVTKTLPEVDPQTKKSDDYPLRVYVLFEYDPERASLTQRMRYSSLKLLFGEFPPLASINYVWTSANPEKPHYESPYTDSVRIIPLRTSTSPLDTWQEEVVNVLKDYRRLFGEEPPQQAALAIMTDSDGLKATTEAALQFIELYSDEQASRVLDHRGVKPESIEAN